MGWTKDGGYILDDSSLEIDWTKTAEENLKKARDADEDEEEEEAEEKMDKHRWSQLNHLQLGRYAEYLAKMEFTLFGFDVYSAEVDDKGIDFIIRRSSDNYYDVQVKSCRKLNYVFFRKDKFEPKNNLLAVIILFENNTSPRLHLIPSTRWLQGDKLFVSRDYEGKKSKPEWGLNLSKSNLHLLDEFTFERWVESIMDDSIQ